MSACSVPIANPTVLGFLDTVPNLGQPASGKGVTLGDALYDEYYPGGNFMWALHLALKCNKQDQNGHYKGKYGWIGVAGVSGFIFGENYGYLSCTIPQKGDGEVLMHGMAARKLHPKKK